MTTATIKPCYSSDSRLAFFADDPDHTPFNKCPGQVDSRATLVVEDQYRVYRDGAPQGDWTQISLTETTKTPGRTSSHTITFALHGAQRKLLRDYLNSSAEFDE